MHMRITVATLLTLGLATAYASAQQVTKQTFPGVTNFARVETTIACGGATTAEAMPELKKMGFKSVINLRQASEQGANIPEAEAAAKAADLNLRPYSVQRARHPIRRSPISFSPRSPSPRTSRLTSTAPAPTAPPRCG